MNTPQTGDTVPHWWTGGERGVLVGDHGCSAIRKERNKNTFPVTLTYNALP